MSCKETANRTLHLSAQQGILSQLTPLPLTHGNCTLFCAPTAQKRTGSQHGKKTIFLDV